MPGFLTDEQTRLLSSWLGPFEVVRDHSWPLQDTSVLHVSTPAGGSFIVKASTTSHHIRREVAALRHGLPGLQGKASLLRYASVAAGILVTEFLPGASVEGSAAEHDPETYRQAGDLLARLHRPAGTSSHYAKKLAHQTQLLIRSARGLVDEDTLTLAVQGLAGLRLGPVQLVTTHGDYQPRNWLHDEGQIKVIDFGRADHRPWMHDLVRLTSQQFLEQPGLEEAFYSGFGRRIQEFEADTWQLENLNQSLGTVVWAHRIGDSAFERSGVETLERTLAGPWA
ncbi:aminoglycoside phosphotransferase family protein [Arthrobacter sp. BB-1]|uniref:phosphotransferase n=1 Tax=unclassified Arthrobacter TaxID=235627 RepID=UPI001111F6A3|nr:MULTISPECIES: aminoglycoside phosphotransferase family protein [unclassified Arthrobacter]TNB70129.1 aminoglycoside phosphotransferase family protein [Arthrobacter sp. BB-1]